MTDRNVLHTRIDVSAGKMIRLEIKRAPIIRIPSTIVTAVSTAISVCTDWLLLPLPAQMFHRM